MMKSRIYKVVAVSIASIVALAGCSSNSGSAAKDDAKASSAEKVEIEYLHRLPDGKGMTTVKEIVDKWNAENPNIQVKPAKFDGKAQDLIKKVQTDTKAGTAACLYQAGYADLAELYVNGMVQDVSKFAKDYEDKFASGPFKSMELEGKTFGLPQDTGPLVYYYNKAAFESLGLDVPKTAEEFIETAKKAAAKGKYIASFQTDESGSILSAMTAAAGDQWFGIDGDKWAVDVQGKGSKAVADFWQKLLDAKAVPTLERWSTDWKSMLNNHTLIGTIGAAWEAPLLADDMANTDNAGEWAIAPLPDLGKGKASGPNGGSGVVVSKNCKHPEQAMKFNAWFNTQVDALASQGLVVAAKDQPKKPEFAKFYGDQDVLAEFNKANAAMLPFTYIPGWSTVFKDLSTHSTAVGKGEKTVQSLLDAAAITATTALKNAGLTVK